MMITLKYGGHETREEGMCTTEAGAFLAGEEHNARPRCWHQGMVSYVQKLNDALGEGDAGDALRMEIMWPHMADFANTAGLALDIAPLLADYKAKLAPLFADYKAKHAPLLADYEAKRAPLRADYEAKHAPLLADYNAKLTLLDADYEAKRVPIVRNAVAALVAHIQAVKGAAK
jgi:hypothetical protein